jgi:hypothetical protein
LKIENQLTFLKNSVVFQNLKEIIYSGFETLRQNIVIQACWEGGGGGDMKKSPQIIIKMIENEKK